MLFEHNRAVSSEEVYLSNKVRVEIDKTGVVRQVKWIIIFASGIEESMATANEMATFFIDGKRVA